MVNFGMQLAFNPTRGLLSNSEFKVFFIGFLILKQTKNKVGTLKQPHLVWSPLPNEEVI